MRRRVEQQVIERFIACGDPREGFARIHCERAWLGELSRIAARLLREAYTEGAPGARPSLVLFVQSFGDLSNFNPHLHVLAADRVFGTDGRFIACPPVPEALLAEGFRRAVLAFLVKAGAIANVLREKLLGWRHTGGFSAHNQVRVLQGPPPVVGAHDAEGRKKLAGYMIRAPMSVAKMSYDAVTGTVIYLSKVHLGLKRNVQVMPGAQWLELLCKHIPDRDEHLVRYAGWYSNRSRGRRAKALKAQQPATAGPAAETALSEFATRARATWARLMRKVYEADPLVCPKCQGPMRVLALIDDPAVVRRTLEHLGRLAPEPAGRGPPSEASDGPRNAVIPLIYHPVPDSA